MKQPWHAASLAALTLALSPSLATAALCVESVNSRLDQFISHTSFGSAARGGPSGSDASLLCSSLDGPFCSLENPSPATPVAANGAWHNVQDGVVFVKGMLVSCGAHQAPSCAECPGGQGKSWCNGDCQWVSGACIRKQQEKETDMPEVSQPVDDQSSDSTTSPGDHSTSDGTASGKTSPGNPSDGTTSPVDVAKVSVHGNVMQVSGVASGRKVSCGRHKANSCPECPQGHGEKWCNGDCAWMHGKECLEKLDTDISCGLHRARNCTDCPHGNGETWCNGDCAWLNFTKEDTTQESGAGECKARRSLPKAQQIVPDPSQNGRKCGGLGSSNRVFILKDAAATIEACGLECRLVGSTCVAWSGLVGEWCVGCSVPLDEPHAGAVAYKKGNSTMVLCGQHSADDCSMCPEGNGLTWCNGDCIWLSHHGGECTERTRVRMLDERHWSGLAGNGLVNVTCGEHKASNCSGCPQGQGALWCHGDCAWFEDECVGMIRLQKLAQAATKEVSCGGATFHDLVGTEVASTTITGGSSLGLDNMCCEACSSNAECEFWVRESGIEGVKTCSLMKQPQGTPHESKTRRGGFKADLVADYASLGVATWCGGAAWNVSGWPRFESGANTVNGCATKCSARTDCTAFYFKSSDCYLFEHSAVDGVYQEEGTCYKKRKQKAP